LKNLLGSLQELVQAAEHLSDFIGQIGCFGYQYGISETHTLR